MPQFLILFRGTDGRSLRLDPDAYQAHLRRLGEWMALLETHGKVLAAEPLAPEPTILRKGHVVTDHPAIESKEMVGGYLRFECDTLAQAHAWAQACPIFEFDDGCIELRGIESLAL